MLVVLDEAYREFVRDAEVPDGIELYRDRPNVCVLRTFSKAYGLAGLRVGFAIAHEPVAAALRKTAVPFGVSQLAQDAAVASLRAEDALLGRVGSLVAERTRVVDGAARPGLDGAGDPGELRLAAAGGAHGRLRGGVRAGRSGRPAVRRARGCGSRSGRPRRTTSS